MPLKKVLETPVTKYTTLMKKWLLREHAFVHAWYKHVKATKEPIHHKTLGELSIADLIKIHTALVRKMKLLGIRHCLRDSLDATLPSFLRKWSKRICLT